MKVNYFKYWLERKDASREKYLIDLAPFMRAIHQNSSVNFKMGFRHGDEHVFMLPARAGTFLLVMTRQNEIIKSISAQTLSVSDIYSQIQQDQMLGFASYIIVNLGYFGIGSTLLAPKQKALVLLMEYFLQQTGRDRYRIVVEPFLTQASRQDVMNAQFIGQSTIRVSRENSFFEGIVGLSGFEVPDFSDVSAFEIKILPKRKRNIERPTKQLIQAIPDEGLEKMTLRVREHLHEQLTEFYVAGKGAISDFVDTRTEAGVSDALVQKSQQNAMLQECLEEHMSNDEFSNQIPNSLASLTDISTWPTAVRAVPDANQRS